MAIARVENGTVAEYRNITLDDVPDHKRSLWRPVVVEGTGPAEAVVVEADQVRRVRSWTPEQTAAERARLKAQVDLDAARERLKYISPGAGMEMTYMEKHNQAQAVIAMGEAAANALTEAERTAQFPTLAASVGIEASTLFGCAQLVSQRYELYATASNGIERTRLAGKKAITDAADAAAAQAAYGAIAWP